MDVFTRCRQGHLAWMCTLSSLHAFLLRATGLYSLLSETSVIVPDVLPPFCGTNRSGRGCGLHEPRLPFASLQGLSSHQKHAAPADARSLGALDREHDSQLELSSVCGTRKHGCRLSDLLPIRAFVRRIYARASRRAHCTFMKPHSE